jgi:hypothetical protein
LRIYDGDFVIEVHNQCGQFNVKNSSGNHGSELRVPAGRLWNRKNSWNLEVKTWKNFQFEKNKYAFLLFLESKSFIPVYCRSPLAERLVHLDVGFSLRNTFQDPQDQQEIDFRDDRSPQSTHLHSSFEIARFQTGKSKALTLPSLATEIGQTSGKKLPQPPFPCFF